MRIQPQANKAEIRMIVGLGNPGKAYERTYHNAGALMLERLARELHAGARTARPLFSYWKIGPHVLVAPKTFMNESGRAIAQAVRFFHIEPEELLVIHDESDLPIGTARFAFGRGTAGHRGVASIVEHLGTKNFSRLRLGIRRDETKTKAGAFVLRPMSATDEERLYSVFDGAITKLMEKITP